MRTAFLAPLSSSTRRALASLGIESDEQLAGVHVPDLLDAGISWGQVHKEAVEEAAEDAEESERDDLV
jgi:hypothetical protein